MRTKRKACDEVGIHSFHSELPETISEEELIDVVKKYNENPDCHGSLVQLPLPKHIDEEKVLGVISLEKDVDGFHPLNIGMLAMKGHEPLFMPCTPKGSIGIEKRVELKGRMRSSLRRMSGCRRHDVEQEGLHGDGGALENEKSERDL